MRKPTVTREQIRAAYEADGKFGPILSTEEVALIVGVSRKTVEDWKAKGRLDGAFRKRGKHNLYWRDRVLDILLNGPDWPSVPGSKRQAEDKGTAD